MTVQILEGHCLDVLRTLPDQSVHCCVTSPPYFGLRDYGVAGQIGLEPTLPEFVDTLVSVFREVRRVLRDDGTCWVNLGDSYAGSWGAQSRHGAGTGRRSPLSQTQIAAMPQQVTNVGSLSKVPGLKPKDLMGMPWRVAFALQEDGWYLRQDIIWHKPNPMPESVTDRCTKAHEYIFLLSKSARYWFDSDAIKEPAVAADMGAMDGGAQRMPDGSKANDGRNFRVSAKGNAKTFRGGRYIGGQSFDNSGPTERDSHGNAPNEALTRNRRSVWTVATEPFKEAHFATFPPSLIVPCIAAGCPPGGTVLDPFGGAGTTGLVADRLQRNAVLIELNPTYAEMARRRIHDDAPLLQFGENPPITSAAPIEAENYESSALTTELTALLAKSKTYE